MRLDHKLVELNLCTSRSQAQDLIKRGFVFVNHVIINKTSYEVKLDDHIELLKDHMYVSRGADKLEGFLNSIQLDISWMDAYDIGASTGGFTEVLLKHQIKSVETIDVGINQLHESIKHHPKVTSHEQTNILGYPLIKKDLAVVDVSFTSVIPILEYIKSNVHFVIVLVKPQFEQTQGFKDVIRDEKTSLKIFNQVKEKIYHLKYEILNEAKSELKGKKGNQEYFLLLKS